MKYSQDQRHTCSSHACSPSSTLLTAESIVAEMALHKGSFDRQQKTSRSKLQCLEDLPVKQVDRSSSLVVPQRRVIAPQAPTPESGHL